MKAAELKTDDMFKNQYFEHVSPIDGRDVTFWAGEVKYQYSYIGENLAMGNFQNEKELVQAWMDSPGHRENILNLNYTQIGVAAKKGMIDGHNTWIAVQIFGKPTLNCTVPNAELKSEIESKTSKYEKINNLNNEIEKLKTEGQNLINQGNAKIDEGNKIYSETGDKEKAQQYWDEGDVLYSAGQKRLDEANTLIEEAKNLSSLYDEIQVLMKEYNKQVDKYNKCIKD
jgi:hypothetical protein